ncbi:hypothetical protein QBC40DRAFT_91061 [Triangularia verruculosa]|uniref:Uncharacterized protein n=1 Tax=Triangularia verruculosa TaxID=2587418 RepID=A0AAN6XPL2_9PEZI|nr:hypothetical protein QBC40DRAFT_91061 [Triangularia verruculosa]
MAPTLTNPLQPRQTTVVVDGNGGGGGGNGGLDTGAIVGIVIGTIAGILLLWWIIRSCTQPRTRRPDPDRQGWYDDTAPRRSRSRSTHSHKHCRHHGRHHSRSHSRRRSTSRPAILQEKPIAGYIVQAPQQAYIYPSRSRSRSQGRYYATNGY